MGECAADAMGFAGDFGAARLRGRPLSDRHPRGNSDRRHRTMDSPADLRDSAGVCAVVANHHKRRHFIGSFSIPLALRARRGVSLELHYREGSCPRSAKHLVATAACATKSSKFCWPLELICVQRGSRHPYAEEQFWAHFLKVLRSQKMSLRESDPCCVEGNCKSFGNAESPDGQGAFFEIARLLSFRTPSTAILMVHCFGPNVLLAPKLPAVCAN